MTGRHVIPLAAAAIAAALVASAPAVAQQKGSQGSQRIGDWKVVCQAQSPCFMTQEIVDADTKLGVAGVAIAKPAGRPATLMQINLAPQVDSSRPLGLSVDGSPPAQIPVNSCDASKCVSRATLPEDVVDRLRKGNEMVLTFGIQGQDQMAAVKFSLKGFTAAYKVVEAKRG